MLLVTGVLVTAFGGLKVLLHDENYIKIKPTFVYAFYALAIGFSVLIKQNVWKLLFRHVFTLPDRIWDVLALRWAAWFAMLSILNEIVRRSMSTEWWWIRACSSSRRSWCCSRSPMRRLCSSTRRKSPRNPQQRLRPTFT